MTDQRVCKPLVASIVCTVLLFPGALFLPSGDPANLAHTLNGHTVNVDVSLVTINGPGVLRIVAVPLVLTLVATCLMVLQLRAVFVNRLDGHRACRADPHWSVRRYDHILQRCVRCAIGNTAPIGANRVAPLDTHSVGAREAGNARY